MKKLFTFVLTMLLTAGVVMAQTSGDTGAGAKADKKITKTPSAASKVSLNPQPLPPGERKAGGDPASKVSLNPQPLPPGERKAGGDPGSKVSINPQPLPPGERKAGGDPASKVSLNPQPLPPKQGKTGSASAESKVALNPQPEPPGVQSSAKKKNAAAGKKVSVPANTTSPK